MPFSELKDEEIAKNIKQLMKKGGFLDVIQQYYRELYTRYYSQCYNISRYFGLNRQDAEDAVQEAFIRLYKNIRSFDDKRAFKPWLFKIVINCVKDRYRDLTKHSYTDIEKAENYPNPAQEKFFEELHIKDTFRGIIIRLPEKLKSAVILRNYTDMDMKSIASILGLGVRQLHNRLARAYNYIKEGLENEKY